MPWQRTKEYDAEIAKYDRPAPAPCADPSATGPILAGAFLFFAGMALGIWSGLIPLGTLGGRYGPF